jgi:lipopolysaccharide heptosyltransferase II
MRRETREHLVLAERNRRLAQLRHRRTFREETRRVVLELCAALPIPQHKPEPDTFLIIRPDQLGDVILTIPAIRALKAARPNARLIGLAGAWSAEAMAALPEIDRVLTLPFPGFSSSAASNSLIQPYLSAWRWGRTLSKLRAETAIIFRPDHWWGGLLAKFAGVPNRIGYDLEDVRYFLTRKIEHAERHSVLQSARLVEPWTGIRTPDTLRLSFPTTYDDHHYVRETLTSAGISAEKPYIVIHPGASTPIKRWNAQNWAIVADRLAARLDAAVVFTGSDREHSHAWEVMDHVEHTSVSVVGETNLSQLAALYSGARVVLGPDTGPLHLAVAAGAPTVHLYGPADPALFGPWGDPSRHVVVTSDIRCRPCRILDWAGDAITNHPCVHEITPRMVYEAAIRAMG